MNTPTPEEKLCNTCGINKPLEAFYKHHTALYGRESLCIECKKAKYNTNKETKKNTKTPTKVLFFGIFH